MPNLFPSLLLCVAVTYNMLAHKRPFNRQKVYYLSFITIYFRKKIKKSVNYYWNLNKNIL